MSERKKKKVGGVIICSRWFLKDRCLARILGDRCPAFDREGNRRKEGSECISKIGNHSSSHIVNVFFHHK